MKSIAIIPARSGSKGLPNKNIKNLNGFPLMSYTIKAALEAECFDEVMVSTESSQYAEIAKRYGANVPFYRSEEMSQDSAGTWDTVREVLVRYKEIGKEFDYVALLQPTSPLRDAYDIKAAFEKLQMNKINNVVSITEVEHPVQWCFKLGNGRTMDDMALSPYNYIRRQDLEKYYRENGAIYIIDAKKILREEYNFYADQCYGYEMPQEKSIDIDTALDFLVAEIILKNNIHNGISLF